MVDPVHQLDECLTAVNDGPRLQRVLRRYPEQRDELIELLKLSVELGDLRWPAPSPGARLRVRNELLAAAEDGRRWHGPVAWVADRFFPRGPFRWAAAAAAGAVMLASGGFAAQNSLPGEPFYPVKLSFQQAQLAITSDPTANLKLRLALANDRLVEAQRLVARRQLPEALSLVTAYDTTVAQFAPPVAARSYAAPDLDSLERELDEGQVTADGRLEALARALVADGDADAAATVKHSEHNVNETLQRTKSRLHAHATKPKEARHASPSPRPEPSDH